MFLITVDFKNISELGKQKIPQAWNMWHYIEGSQKLY